MQKKPSRPKSLRRSYPDLATYIRLTGDSQEHIAARVGTTQANISKIARGDAVPRSLLALALARYCRIPVDSFHRVAVARDVERRRSKNGHV
jgi:transcriptional regulator with XRE-family HTH domain